MTATMLVAGNMIGSGIYLLPATLAAFGSVSLVGWAVSGAAAMLLALVFAGLFRVRSEAHGMIAQVRAGLGPFASFQTTFFYWTGGWIGNVAIAVAAAGYLGALFPALRGAGAATTLAILWVLTALNFFGARRVAQFQGLTLAIGIVPIAIAIALGAVRFDAQVFMESWNVSGRSDAAVVPAMFVSIFWAFLGLESAAVCAAVVRSPERNVPIAVIGGVALTAAIYVAGCAALMGLMPASQLAASSAPFADAVARVVGVGASALVAVCAVLRASGALSGWILATAESARSAAETRVFPVWFLEKSGSLAPRKNILIVAALMTASHLLSLSPTLGAQFSILINVATVLFLVIYAYCCAALWRLSARAPGQWGWRTLSVLAAAFCVWAIAASDPGQLIYAAAIFALTLPLYLFARRSGASE
ncbi:MAG: amino acid permease, partial [Hyphomonadaceae bacterium]